MSERKAVSDCVPETCLTTKTRYPYGQPITGTPLVLSTELDAEASNATPGFAVEGVIYFSLQELRAPGPFPKRVDPVRRERYLTDDDFASCFGMAKPEFAGLPKWHQLQLKSEVGLF